MKLLFTSIILIALGSSSLSAQELSDLEVHLDSFAVPYAGKFFGLRVKDSADKTLSLRWRAIPSCPTSVYFHELVDAKEKHTIDFVVDTNSDFRFSLPPDRAYSTQTNENLKPRFNPKNEQVTLTQFETGQNLPKNNYSASLEFKNFSPHVGKTLGLRLVDLEGGHVRAETKVRLQGPCHHFYLENILESYHSYRLDIFADRDGNSDYDGLGKDRSWILYFSQVADEVKQVFDYNDQKNAAFFDKKIEGF